MADDSKTSVILDLDNSEFVEKLKESLGLLGQFGRGEGLDGLLESLKAIGEISGIIGAGFLAVKTAIDLTTEAEKIKQVEKSFDALADSVGLAGDALKNKLVAAAHGLVSETELLEAGNQAIVKMGENANKIPEIMELARKATVLTGGDLISNFNQLTSAISAGNVKMLRHYGIIIDATKAQDEYARSQGYSRDYLDDTGKRLAVMNAALEQGRQKFANIDESSLKATNSLKSIGVTFKELGEISALIWDKVAGSWVSDKLQNIAEWMGYIKHSIESTWKVGNDLSKEHAEYLQNNINELKLAIPLWEKTGNAIEVAEKKKQLAGMEAELAKINDRNREAIEVEKKKAAEAQKAEAAEGGKKKGIDYVKVEKDREKFNNDLIKLTQARVQSESKIIGTEAEAEELSRQEIIKIRTKQAQDIENLDKQFLQKGVITKAQFQKAADEIHKKANADVQKADMQLDQQRIQALKNYEAQNKNTAAGITAAWHTQSRQAEMNFKDMSKLGNQTFNTLKTNSVSAFEAIGNGSKSAGDAMKGFFFGSIGDTAIAQGTEMLMSGVWPPNPIAIAGGGALIAFGAALKSQGTSSGSSVPSASGGSGGSPSVSTTADQTQQPTPSPTTPGQTVQINFAGHYFDSDNTRQRLVQMIQDASNATDFQFKTIGQP